MSYLTDAAATASGGTTPTAGPLRLVKQYSASVVLTGQGLRLAFGDMPGSVHLAVARVFVGARGPMPAAVVLIDPARPVAYAATAKAIYRMDYSAGQPLFAVHPTTNLAQDWANRQQLAYA